MKRQGRLFAIIITCMISLVLLAGLYPQTALADSYTSTTMRLLRFEGNVEIEDASGKPRAVMENARLSSGESMKTAAASSASVGLDEGRIVTLDEKSRVEFKKQDGAVSMNLTEGKIFLDVSEKLGEGESMGVTTATMAIGIRGTIIYASCMPVTDESAAGMESVDLKGLSPEKGHIVSISQIGVLEGTAQITYTDNSNKQQTVAVEAGKKATVPEYSEDAEGIPEPKVSDLTKEDIEGFVKNQVASSASVVDRVQEACDVADDIDITDLAGLYTADGDWTWDSPVTLVAQSASKYYDGQPLTRSSDILVDGLPSIFTVKASAGGSRTDAGESDNSVDNYAIFNKAGQDVTRHFTKINTVSGTLLVVPAPLTIHTGTAEKVYDGTVLTEPDAYVTFYKGSGSREVPWRNTSYVVTEPAANVSYDNQTLYGICGVIWVNAANPLTGERREIQLKAGQKLTVFISDLAGKQSIEFKIEKLTENDLPAELLRLYADNPALLEQACKDAGWNISLIRGRIEALPATASGGASSGGATASSDATASGGAAPSGGAASDGATASGDAMIEQGGLMIRESESDRLMQNLTNVRITVDTDITDYNNRALGSEEAHYSGLAVDESIKVTPTGRQTDVGKSVNTYTIDWGTANRSNYEVSEDLGNLTVTPASATITTGSAEKAYDGTPLTNSEASISGLVAGETATITATGTITEVGSTVNTYTIDWGTASPSNYTVSEDLGTLQVTAAAPTPVPAPYGPVTLTSASASKTYDGTALTADSFTSEGLPSGFTVSATVSGSQTDAGSSDNTIDSYTIYDVDGNDVTDQFPEVTLQSGTLTVDPFPVEFDLGFRGEEIIDEGDSDSGDGGSDSGSGSGDGGGSPAVFEYMGYTYFPEWVRASYEGTDEPVDPIDYNYDGEVAGAYSFTFTLPYGAKLELNGTGYRDAGSYTFEPESTFLEGKKTNYEISFANNKLEIAPAPLTITASATKEYDGEPLMGSDAVKIEGLAEGESISVTSTEPEPVTITNAGTINNPYTVNWLDTNPNNYTVTQEPGVLEITPKKVTITTGSTDKVYDGETLFYNSYELSPSDPWVNGAAPKITVTGSIKNVGFTPNTCMVEWKGVNPNNYTVTQKLGTLTVKPVELVLIQNCAFGVSGNITIESYGLKVQVNNVDSPYYEVTPMGENRWWIQFEWGDKIEARIAVTTDETSYAITPDYDFVLGDSGNYKIDTVDATGEFDIPPVYPIGGFGMGKPAAFSRSVGAAAASNDKGSVSSDRVDQQEPPLEGSDPSESIQDAGQANEDDPEEPSEEALEPISDEPQEEPLDEPYVEPFEEEIPEEEPQEDSSDEEPKEETSQENSSEEETSQENSSEGEL
ncbi:MAG: FecR domain-containing protein [Lachnospiraceae bacterium]|nr:FecR domain-containing protein [Lachnospiraceae bacterium]